MYGKQQREVSDIRSIETRYSIPFSAEKMDELHDEIGLSKNGCSFLLQHPNGLKISALRFEGWRIPRVSPFWKTSQ